MMRLWRKRKFRARVYSDAVNGEIVFYARCTCGMPRSAYYPTGGVPARLVESHVYQTGHDG